jgi:hypothetical protein
MFTIKATVQYYTNWAIAWIDPQLIKYYRSLVPHAKYVKPPMNDSHVSIVRIFEKPLDKDAWGRYNKEEIEVMYDPYINFDDTYFWLDAWSDEIGYIRRSLGLPTFRDSHPYSYHITIGNLKDG